MTRKDLAYKYLKEMILSNNLASSSPIRETEIASKLKMSRTPLREAMRELEKEGLIISYPSQGSYVTRITPYDIEEICELRLLFELYAIEKSFNLFNNQELDYLVNYFEKTFKDESWEEYHKADRILHGLIIEKAGNKRLIGFIETLNIQIERVRRMSAYKKMRRQHSFVEHMEIINNIRNNDFQKCKVALKKHLKSVENSSIEVAKLIEVNSNIIYNDTKKV